MKDFIYKVLANTDGDITLKSLLIRFGIVYEIYAMLWLIVELLSPIAPNPTFIGFILFISGVLGYMCIVAIILIAIAEILEDSDNIIIMRRRE